MTGNNLKSYLGHPIAALLGNLLLLCILYALTRLAFVLCNLSMFSDHLTLGYLCQLMWAGLRFDTSAILYLNFWLILAFLLPWHGKDFAQTGQPTPSHRMTGRHGSFRPRANLYYRILRWMYVVVNFIGLAGNLCDCAYFPFTGRRTTGSVLQEFGSEGNILTILFNEALPYWYLFLLAGLLGWLLWRGFRIPAIPAPKAGRRWPYYLIQTTALLTAIPLTIGGMRGGFTTAVRPITISNANQYVHHSIDAGIVLNTPFSILRTFNKKPFPNVRYMTDDEALALYSPLHQPADSAAFRPMNVVVFILESFGKQASARGFTPFLDSLARKGRSFRYSYANGRKSIDGMPSVLSSIPSFIEPFFLTPAALNDLSGLAGELSAHKGYHSAFFHGAENGSMGFQAFANATGWQQYFGRTEYNQDAHYHGDADFDGTWAIWDEEFLQFFCDKMSEMPQPFITSVFTASSHAPFRLPERYQGRFPKGPTPLYACISYSDNALRLFFEKAARQPWFRNTLFVLTADHTTAADDPVYQTDLGRYDVPVIFYAPSMPDLHGEDTERIVSQADIMPTVLSLLRYDRPYIAFGEDALGTPPERTFAINYLPGAGYYQYLQQDWMLQFDGENVVHAYQFRQDTLLRNDLSGHHPEEAERHMKSIIQQYMHRMNHNEMKVTPNP